MTKILGPLKNENFNNGHIIVLNNLLPKIEQATDSFGITDYKELIYVFSLQVIYKFQCEDFISKFESTLKFSSIHFKIGHMKKNILFKNQLEKLYLDNISLFFDQYLTTLESEIKSYYGDSAKPLVKKLLIEIDKLKEIRSLR